MVAGAANGLLPCGLVYTALTVAGALGRARDAVLLMAGFGLGTAPALLLLPVCATSLPPALRLRLRRLTPIVLVFSATLLFGRAWSTPHQHEHRSQVAAPAARH